MKKIVALLGLLSISYAASAAVTVNCTSQSAVVVIGPADVEGRHNVSTDIVKANARQKTTYQPQICSIDSQTGQLNSASCKTPNDVMNAAFVLEKNGATFDLKQKVEIKGMSAEMLAPLNFTIASGLACSATE